MRTEVSRELMAALVCLILVGGTPRFGGGQEFPRAPAGPAQAAADSDPAGNRHPLHEVLEWAKLEVEAIEKSVLDYSATVMSRERIDGELRDYETVFVKIRHRPLSIYAYVVSPDSSRGNEAIYVEGKNGNKLLVHTTGITGKLIGTLAMEPSSPMAMQGRRHPINQIGILHLCRELVRSVESDLRHKESQVRILTGAKVNGRRCTCMELSHPVPRAHFQFHLARIFVDEELKLPIRYEQYTWPKNEGGAPELVEEYTYLNVKLNNGFRDEDFDPRNPQYSFD